MGFPRARPLGLPAVARGSRRRLPLFFFAFLLAKARVMEVARQAAEAEASRQAAEEVRALRKSMEFKVPI